MVLKGIVEEEVFQREYLTGHYRRLGAVFTQVYGILLLEHHLTYGKFLKRISAEREGLLETIEGFVKVVLFGVQPSFLAEVLDFDGRQRDVFAFEDG